MSHNPIHSLPHSESTWKLKLSDLEDTHWLIWIKGRSLNFGANNRHSGLELHGRVVDYELLLWKDTLLILEQEGPQLLKADPLLGIWVQQTQDNALEDFRIVLVIEPFSCFGCVDFRLESLVGVIIDIFDIVEKTCTEDSCSDGEGLRVLVELVV